MGKKEIRDSKSEQSGQIARLAIDFTVTMVIMDSYRQTTKKGNGKMSLSILAQEIQSKLRMAGVYEKAMTGTLALRDHAKSVGFNYWENLRNANAIDELDSLIAKGKTK